MESTHADQLCMGALYFYAYTPIAIYKICILYNWMCFVIWLIRDTLLNLPFAGFLNNPMLHGTMTPFKVA